MLIDDWRSAIARLGEAAENAELRAMVSELRSVVAT
jgi:hypothetical protein